MTARRRALAFTALLAATTATIATSTRADAAQVPNSPFNVMVGSRPHVAVAPDGTGYIVAQQYSSPGFTGLVRLCVLPRGARRCASTSAFVPVGGEEFLATAPYVFTPSATEVDVLAYSSDGNHEHLQLWHSTDRGRSFATSSIGTINPSGDLVAGPGAAYTGITDITTFGVKVQSAPLTGTTAAPTRITSNEDDSALAVLPDGSVLAAASATDVCPCGLSVLRAAPGANLADPASWVPVGHPVDGMDSRLTTGPAGTFLLTHVPIADLWQVSKYNPATLSFGAPVTITRSDNDNRMALRETANGWVYALIQGMSGGNGRPELLFRSRNGVAWAHTTLASFTNAYSDEFDVANDGGGFAVHDQLLTGLPVTVVPIPVPRSIADRVARGHVTGKVLPAKARQPIQLQVLKRHKWVTVRTAGTNGAGQFAMTAPTAAGTYRVVAAAVEGYAEADARPFTVKPKKK